MFRAILSAVLMASVAFHAGVAASAPPKQGKPPKAPPAKLTPEEAAARLDAETETVQKFVKDCDAAKAKRIVRLKEELAAAMKARPVDRERVADLRALQKELPGKDPLEFVEFIDDRTVGVGKIGGGFIIRIEEIRDNQEFVGTVSFPKVPDGQALSRDWTPKKHPALVQGVSTEGHTDDSLFDATYERVWEIAETKKVDGRTMFVIRPLDIKALRDRLGR